MKGASSLKTMPKKKKDPLDTPLPCDVQIGHITFRKGVHLRTLVHAAGRWFSDAERLWDIEHPGAKKIVSVIHGKPFRV